MKGPKLSPWLPFNSKTLFRKKKIIIPPCRLKDPVSHRPAGVALPLL